MHPRSKLSYEAYARVRARLIKDQDGCCYYCVKPVYTSWRDAPGGRFNPETLATIDHIEPVSKGGTWKRYNIVVACKKCNNLKADMPEEEFHELVMRRITCTEVVDSPR